MEYKKQYTKEEVEELAAWLEAHRKQMPKDFYLDKATHIGNLPEMVPFYIDIIRKHHENSTYSGQVYTIFRMRDVLKEQYGLTD